MNGHTNEHAAARPSANSGTQADPHEDPRPALSELHLCLYISGSAPNSLRALATLRQVCLEHFGTDCQLEIVDVWQQASRALRDGILVTPTLRRLAPQPEVTIIGDLSDTRALYVALGLGG